VANLPDMTGVTLGRYQLINFLGGGAISSVYVAAPIHQISQPVAVKVLDPMFVDRVSFGRLENDLRLVSTIGHPHILPIQEFGVAHGYVFLVMPMAPGGTLKQLMDHGALDPGRAWRVLRALADALHHAHERGVVHRDVKPSNVLFDTTGEVLLGDFGVARLSYGVPGTPGYMAPEQVIGEPTDRRADVYALAVLAFEMLTGTRMYPDASTPDLVLATVRAAVPSAVARRPELPPELDEVLSRALAKSPSERHHTTIALLHDLARVPIGRARPADQAPAQVEIAPEAYKGTFSPTPEAVAEDVSNRNDEEAFRQTETQLMAVFSNTLTAAIAVDESSFIVGWNAHAEDTFGWSEAEVVGRTLSSTLIPPQYCEAHERGFKKYLATGEGPVLGQKIEITAMHRDGREFPIELSISPAARSRTKALFVGFARDLTSERRRKQMAEAQAAVAEALEASAKLEDGGPRILEAIGTTLGWKVGALWQAATGDGALRARHLWKAADFECREFEQMTMKAAFARDVDLPGRVLASGDAVWIPDVLAEELPRTLAAVRAGLHSAVAVPILQAGEVSGVLEYFGNEVQPEDAELLSRLYDIGRRIGRRYRKAVRTTQTEQSSET
jgi:PAS domain S-box-containing protein